MEVTEEIMELISEIEYIIGSSCSCNAGYYEDECEFRYPYIYETTETVDDRTEYYEHKSREFIVTSGLVNPDNLSTVHYKFGRNELHVGEAVVKILEFLEWRYRLDFHKLEKKVPVRGLRDYSDLYNWKTASETVTRTSDGECTHVFFNKDELRKRLRMNKTR